MTCQQFAEFMAGYFDGDLPAETRRRFDAHLAACPDCVRYLARYRDTIDVSRLACDAELPAEVPEDLVKAILSSRKKT